MNFETFQKYITDEISVYSTVQYGSIGIEYLFVLVVEDGKIRPIGEIFYRAFRESLATPEQLKEFGKQCEKFRIGQLEKMPIFNSFSL